MVRKIKKYLGVDWGEKRIGLALGDSETKVVSPFKIVESLDEILRVVQKEKVDIIIIGKPFKMQDRQFKMQKEFLDFLNLLKQKVKIPIKAVDERLSSKQADALPGDRKTKASQDAIAAMIILQSYLDRLNTK